ncbi:type II secretion system F family protein [Thermoanaerobacterium sp. DL9XJH110]|uniref:type II secretion system F family protein n=1 Tax=Thermoanaerobacterium sp. DL9XJH110 TaxID=3386643 RepID=UPI003BB56786
MTNAVLLFIAIYFLLDIKLNGSRVKRFYFREYEKVLKKVLGNNGFLKRRYEDIQKAILRSGIKNYIPLDAGAFICLCMGLFILAFFFFMKLGILAALMYAAATIYVPFAVLSFMTVLNQRKIKGMYLNFLNTFSGFFNIEGNMVNSIKSAAEYVGEPLRSILRRHVTVYERSMKSMEEFLDGIMSEISDREFRKFFKFAGLHAKYGGNFQKALAKLREQGEKLAGAESQKGAGAAVSTMIILVMIVINLMMIVNISGDTEAVYILKNTLTGQMILVSNAAAIIFALFMIKNINALD